MKSSYRGESCHKEKGDGLSRPDGGGGGVPDAGLIPSLLQQGLAKDGSQTKAGCLFLLIKFY